MTQSFYPIRSKHMIFANFVIEKSLVSEREWQRHERGHGPFPDVELQMVFTRAAAAAQ